MLDTKTELLHLLVNKLDGFSVDLVNLDTDTSREGFSVGRGRSVALDDIVDICTNPWHKIVDIPPPVACNLLFAYFDNIDGEWVIDNHTYDDAMMVQRELNPYTHWQMLTNP